MVHFSCSQRNPDYDSTYWFKNDFAAVLADAPEPGTVLCSLDTKWTPCAAFTV